jgi:hypothetical protein
MNRQPLRKTDDNEYQTADELYLVYKNLSGLWVVNGPGIKRNKLAYTLADARRLVSEAQDRQPIEPWYEDVNGIVTCHMPNGRTGIGRTREKGRNRRLRDGGRRVRPFLMMTKNKGDYHDDQGAKT